MSNFDISLIITAHNEGLLAHRTLNSALASVANAKASNVSTQIIVVLDNPSDETRAYFDRQREVLGLNIFEVDFKDTGPSRNFAVSKAHGNYVAFLDADDIICENWLLSSFNFFKSVQNKNIILHPQYLLFFGQIEDRGKIFKLQEVIDFNHNEFNKLNLIEHNYWSALCFTTKEILLATPYKKMLPGFGYEDWEFNIETVAKGIRHHVVPETIHFIRQRGASSRSAKSSQVFTTILPNKLFAVEVDKAQNINVLDEQLDSSDKFNPTFALRSIYRGLKSHIAPFKHKNIRFYRFLATVAHEAVIPAVKKLLRKPQMNNIPNWVITEWQKNMAIEPNLMHDLKRKGLIYHDWIKPSVIAPYYRNLYADFDITYSHVFLLPWLNPGGADLVALNYINFLNANNCDIAVILTNNTESTWINKLPENVKLIEFGKKYGHLNFEEQRNLLLRVLLQRPAKNIHNINSYLGYELYQKNGLALMGFSNLWASLFAPEVEPSGRMSGYAINYLPSCFDYLNGIFTDNKAIIDLLTDIYGYEREKFQVHYQPTKINLTTQTNDWQLKDPSKLNVLWASRLDFEKRIDVLLNIVKNCQDNNIIFHVWGSSVLSENSFAQELFEQKNVIYNGGFNDFRQISAPNYDVFLYTSNSDGLPNILLEAMASGLPCVAPNVGGIKELIINDKTGFLIDDNVDFQAYLNVLEYIRGNTNAVNEIVKNAYDLIQKRHTYSKFAEVLNSNSDYCCTDLAPSTILEYVKE